jgi:hypothetical protein
MASIFSKFKDPILDYVEDNEKNNLRFPLRKTGNILNNYNKGDFIIVGGRKTSGKSSFILHNYVISPLIQKINAKKQGTPFDVKVIYLNTRKNVKSTIERMIVNYNSQKNGGTKIGVPSLYGVEGNHVKLSAPKAKALITSTMSSFDHLSEKGILSAVSGRKSLYEIDNLIRNSMQEYGDLDEETGEFIYKEEHAKLIPIVCIDDITAISTDSSSSVIRTESAHQLANKLKELAKTYNMIIVLAVPSSSIYIKAAGHMSSLEEVAPYHMYADRVIILHNPLETADKHMLGYETADFVNPRTGICYLRTAFIAANFMGVSGLYLGYFMYPENGHIIELPTSEKIDEVELFADMARE